MHTMVWPLVQVKALESNSGQAVWWSSLPWLSIQGEGTADVLMVVFLVEEPGCCVGGGLFPWDHEIEIPSLSSFIKCPQPSSVFASYLEGEAAVE